MDAQPKPVFSNQSGPYEKLEAVVSKYLQSDFCKPVAEHSKQAFDIAHKEVSQWQGTIVLDSCCGVGESTLHLARKHSDSLVIGIDKSAHRLAKNNAYRTDNVRQPLLIRADLNDFWRLAVEHEWNISHHYILYPNPWPKQKHFRRRWHGAPVFRHLIELGGQLELRSNWRLYLQEFSMALAVAGKSSDVQELDSSQAAITPFERKYRATEQVLWRLQSNLC